MVLWFGALPPGDRMCVIEADQPLAIRSVQREGVVNAVWLLSGGRDPRYDEPDRVTALGIHHEHLSIEIEQYI